MTATIDTAVLRADAARLFIARHRQRREQYAHRTYRPATLLALWCAWEEVRDTYARCLADAVVNGHDSLVPDYAARYAVAVERMNSARWRYSAAAKAKREAGAQ